MLRAEHCICGTSTTGTGTLTLAACPQPPGGTDLYQAFQVQGLGTSVAIPVSYTIVEYTGSDFQIASKQEKGIGSLTLGASITATTLARTTVQQTATGMTGAATYNTASPSAITITTAANVLVFIGASASDLLACSPYFDNNNFPSSSNFGALPVNVGGVPTDNITLFRGCDNYYIFEWRIPMLIKRVKVDLVGTLPSSSRLYGRLYSIGDNAMPTKLLYDFGTFSGLSPLATPGTKQTTATGSGFYLQAGEYYLDLVAFSSTAQNAVLNGFPQAYNTGRLSQGIGAIPVHLKASSASTLAGDPANVTSINFAGTSQLLFGFNIS